MEMIDIDIRNGAVLITILIITNSGEIRGKMKRVEEIEINDKDNPVNQITEVTETVIIAIAKETPIQIMTAKGIRAILIRGKIGRHDYSIAKKVIVHHI